MHKLIKMLAFSLTLSNLMASDSRPLELMEGSNFKDQFDVVKAKPNLFYGESDLKAMLAALKEEGDVEAFKSKFPGKDEDFLTLLFNTKGAEEEDGKPFKTDAFVQAMRKTLWKDTKVDQDVQRINRALLSLLRSQVDGGNISDFAKGKNYNQSGRVNRPGGMLNHDLVFYIADQAKDDVIGRGWLRVLALQNMMTFRDPAFEIGKLSQRANVRDRFYRVMSPAEIEAYQKTTAKK